MLFVLFGFAKVCSMGWIGIVFCVCLVVLTITPFSRRLSTEVVLTLVDTLAVRNMESIEITKR